jgi:hypothetical protein
VRRVVKELFLLLIIITRMMKQTWKLALLSLLFLIAFSSCTKEIEEECLTSTCLILGKWNQMSMAGMMGIVHYNVGDITWTFNQGGTVDIVINVYGDGSPLPSPIMETANYTINGNEMQVGNDTWIFSMSGREFNLVGNLALDGSQMRFELD